MLCRLCRTTLGHVFCDLGHAPPSNSFLTLDELDRIEKYYPLKVWTCHNCFLTQLDEVVRPADIFSNRYAYFSSASSTWVAHAKNFVESAVRRYGLGKHSFVVEVACNDGYLLQFVQKMGIPCLGIEPSSGVAASARGRGVSVREAFFGEDLARSLVREGIRADLIVAMNVLGHVPDIIDFVKGFEVLLTDDGIAVFEVPHLLRLVQGRQFDTIYHEHFQYLSVSTVEKLMNICGLRIVGIKELPTHGGSVRIYVSPIGSRRKPHRRVDTVQAKERAAGMEKLDFYTGFQPEVAAVKYDLLSFLIDARRRGRRVAAYGAAAKGSTLLNFCGVRSDMISFVCDLSESKQGLYMPGCHIPIRAPEALFSERPDYVLVLPWNLRAEIVRQLAPVAEWGAEFVVAVPKLEVFGPTCSRARL